MAILTYLNGLMKKYQPSKGVDEQSLDEHTTSGILKLIRSTLTDKNVLDLLLDHENGSSKSCGNKCCQKNVIVVIQARKKRPRASKIQPQSGAKKSSRFSTRTSDSSGSQENKSVYRPKRQSLVPKANVAKKIRLSSTMKRQQPTLPPAFSSTLCSEGNTTRVLHSTLRTNRNFKSFPEHKYSTQYMAQVKSTLKLKTERKRPAKDLAIDYASTPIKTSPKTSTPNSTPVKSASDLFY